MRVENSDIIVKIIIIELKSCQKNRYLNFSNLRFT